MKTTSLLAIFTAISLQATAKVGDQFAFKCKNIGAGPQFTLEMKGQIVQNNVGTNDELVTATLYLPPNDPLPYYVGHYDAKIPRYDLHLVRVSEFSGPPQHENGHIVADFSPTGKSLLYLNKVTYDLKCEF